MIAGLQECPWCSGWALRSELARNQPFRNGTMPSASPSFLPSFLAPKFASPIFTNKVSQTRLVTRYNSFIEDFRREVVPTFPAPATQIVVIAAKSTNTIVETKAKLMKPTVKLKLSKKNLLISSARIEYNLRVLWVFSTARTMYQHMLDSYCTYQI